MLFKDGLLTTYKKAKQWNIPLVSILFVEACRKNMKLMDPKYYPISNVEKYENPEIYKKSKKFREMQPKFTSKMLTNTAISNNNNGKKTVVDNEDENDDEGDIFQFRKSPIVVPQNKTQIKTKDSIKKILDKPIETTKSININTVKKSLFQQPIQDTNSENDHNSSLPSALSEEIELEPIQCTPNNGLRKSTRYSTSIYATPLQRNAIETPKSHINRRKTIHTPCDNPNSSIAQTPDMSIVNTTKLLSAKKNDSEKMRRRTIFTPNLMEETLPQSTVATQSQTISTPHPMDLSFPPESPNPHNEIQKHNRRRTTLYTPNALIVQENRNFIVKSQLLNDESPTPTLLVPKSVPSNKHRRRTVFDLSTSTHTPDLFGLNTPAEPESSQTDLSKSISNISDFKPDSDDSQYHKNQNTKSSNPASPAVKKRYLFNPNSMTDYSIDIQKMLSNSAKKSNDRIKTVVPKSIEKRQKTFESPISVSSSHVPKIKQPHFSRRSTLDFTMSANKLSQKTPTKFATPTASSQFSIGTQYEKSKSYMAITNMHQEQVEIIKEVSNNS